MSVKTTGKGRVARVIGPVVDIEFPAGQMPSIFNALHVETTMSGTTRTLTLEVAQHIGDRAGSQFGSGGRLFEDHRQRLSSLNLQRQLGRGHGANLRRGMADDFGFDEVRGQNAIVQNEAQQHAETHLDAEERTDADEDQARLEAQRQLAHVDTADAQAEVDLAGNPLQAIP